MNKSVIIASPNQENQAELNTRIEETVQMSTYQIKRQLSDLRKVTLAEYKELGEASNALQKKTHQIHSRVHLIMENSMVDKACILLGEMNDFIDIGDSGTYFDDNRDEPVDRATIARALIGVSVIHAGYIDVLKTKAIRVCGQINLFGGTHDNIDRLDTEEVVFTPRSTAKEIPLTKKELEHFEKVQMTSKSEIRCNKEINDIDLKLKNMDSLTEDIRYGMLAKKAEAQGDTSSMDMATEIANAFIAGVEPSTLLLEK
jgi:hypothetical protein